MTDNYTTPGVYIKELPGTAVIAGVSTSVAAFIGPALRGPMDEARRITSFDEFISLYGQTLNGRPWPYLFAPGQGRPYYMAFGVEGFFVNGGQQAYIMRVGTGVQASLPLKNQQGADVFLVRAKQDGAIGNSITVQTQLAAEQTLTTGRALVTSVSVADPNISVDTPLQFRVGDFVTTDGANRAQIKQIQGSDLALDGQLAGATQGNTLRIADITPDIESFRLDGTDGLASNSSALLTGYMANNLGAYIHERVQIQSINTATNVVTLRNAPRQSYSMDAAAAARLSLRTIRTVAIGQTVINVANGTTLTVAAPDQLRPGDIVTVNGADRAQISRISGNEIFLDQPLPGAIGGALLRIADIIPKQTTFRLADVARLAPGTVVLLQGTHRGNPVSDYGVIRSVSGTGLVSLEPHPEIKNTFNLDVAAGSEPILIPQEFRLIITPPSQNTGAATSQRFENLSLNPFHPRYIFNAGLVNSDIVNIAAPDKPPTAAGFPEQLVEHIVATSLTGGTEDQPEALTAANYSEGLAILRDIDAVNLVCIPDAAAHPAYQDIQQAMIEHCLENTLQDRFAILDAIPNAPPSGSNSIEDQRTNVQSERGFAALYYPWLQVRDPTSSGPLPRRMLIPPSGHIAGLYARSDSERGVHKAPANMSIRGVMGLERVLSDAQQGPLNQAGINVLRIFPGSGQVIVWGARTTVEPNDISWRYVNVRRLMLYLEESIAEGIRWAVFEPNNLALWQKLKRTITEFLTRVWRDGALFGATAEQAFYVRIDEGLNPPSTRALGRLYIEIGVAPVRPAEFIIVRIGLWDNGSDVSEA